MSKQGYISRYLLIISKLKAKPFSTYGELRHYINHNLQSLQLSDDELHIGFSKRTLQRDLRDIRRTFGIDIEYSRSQKGYYIVSEANENMNFKRMLNAFELYNSLNFTHDLSNYIHLEDRQPQGLEHLQEIIESIGSKNMLRFNYFKFWDNSSKKRITEPYGIKEFRHRWYLVAKDVKDKKVKSFALDRISELDTLAKKYTYPKAYNFNEEYKNSFGIMSPKGVKPQDIILFLDPLQANYVKTLPIHHSQKIIKENKAGIQIKLHLCITYDFVLELLSFGANLKVLAPKNLIEIIKEAHKEAYEQYE